MRAEMHNGEPQFHRRWRPALFSFFLRRVKNHAEAEDLTQEVFARLLATSPDMESQDAYIFKVAVNMLHDRDRRKKVRLDHACIEEALNQEEFEPLDPHRVAAGKDMLAALVTSMNELPDRTRDIFALYRIENIDQGTIAQAYGISRSAVKKHVMKAMAHLMARVRESE
jgi:RNA polymerase sigma-70 factor (ECF subfamily)